MKRRERRFSRSSGWRIAASVVPAAAALGLLVYLSQAQAPSLALRTFYAAVTGWVLNVFGAGVVIEGTDIVGTGFSISVVTACTGLFVTGLFITAVAAFPVSWHARLLGAVIGILGLFVLNVVRLASLFYIGTHWPSVLDIAHQLVWQSIVIVAAVSIWLFWAGKASARKAGA